MVSTLRSALEELQGEDLRYLGDEELEADFGELERAADQLAGERLRRLAEIDRRGSFRRDGYLSSSSWVADRFRMAWSVATHQVRVARALEHMPATRRALAEGEVSRSAVRVLVQAREANPGEFASAEPSLVEAARTLSARELKNIVSYWRQAVDHPQVEEHAERLHELRRLHVSPTIDGMVRVDGDLDPETGQTLITALRSVQDATARVGPDLRTFPQRRADALGEICRRWLDSPDRPVVAGERPHVVVTVDLEALEGRPGAALHRCEFDDVGPVSPETARRWACDASIARVITRGISEPLDVGRRTPVVPAALRRAVVLRDGHCRFPGCDRPHSWCDAHHMVHWADGGPTALSNLILLCRPHHRLVHHGFGVDVVDGSPTFSRPDGSPLEDRGPP